jgi:hypothetical protein
MSAGNVLDETSRNVATTTMGYHHHEILIAKSIGITVEEYRAMKTTFQHDSEHLHQHLRSLDVSGPVKHQLHCQHRLKYGRQPGVCPNCWSYSPICICSESGKQRSPPEQQLDLFQIRIWTHHKEWGSPSNTGKVLSIAFPPPSCLMLMKGLDEHDAQLYESISSSTTKLSNRDHQRIIPVVLWPKNCGEHHNNNDKESSQQEQQRKAYTIREFREKFLTSDDNTAKIKKKISPQQRIVVLIA